MLDGSDRPIAFASRSLAVAEDNTTQVDKETLNFLPYRYWFNFFTPDTRFNLVRDHQPLAAILHPKKGVSVTNAAHVQRWALFLAAFIYDMEFKRTEEHTNADRLSHMPILVEG